MAETERNAPETVEMVVHGVSRVANGAAFGCDAIDFAIVATDIPRVVPLRTSMAETTNRPPQRRNAAALGVRQDDTYGRFGRRS